MRVFHQIKSYLSCPHPASNYERGESEEGSSHFDETLSIRLTRKCPLECCRIGSIPNPKFSVGKEDEKIIMLEFDLWKAAE